jgi:hypothetical protein
MQYGVHKLVKNTCASYHVRHDKTHVPPNYGRVGKQAVSRYFAWLIASLERVLSGEFAELISPKFPRMLLEQDTYVVLSTTSGQYLSAHTKMHIAQ